VEDPCSCPPDQERPEDIIDDMVSALDTMHAGLATAAVQVGEEKERVKALRPTWQAMADTQVRDPDAVAIYQTGINALAAYRDELHGATQQLGSIPQALGVISGSTAGTAAITSVTQTFVSRRLVSFAPPPPTLPPKADTAKVEEALRTLDPALAATYGAIREALFGTRLDPERAALYESRHAFDHLFSILAPDNEVRTSSFWSAKTEGDPSKVTRDERLRYAANTHARTPASARSLIASSRHMRNVHDALSRAHTRGELDPHQARASLREMDVLIAQWIEAIDVRSIVGRRHASA
jgi:hypothetical protein